MYKAYLRVVSYMYLNTQCDNKLGGATEWGVQGILADVVAALWVELPPTYKWLGRSTALP